MFYARVNLSKIKRSSSSLLNQRIGLNVILAIDETGAIGYQNRLPWQHTPLKKDLSFFKHMTTYHPNSAVIMGSNTWNSLNHRPLKDRTNVVISSNQQTTQSFPSIHNYIQHIQNKTVLHSIDPELNDKPPSLHWIIGGKQIYEHIFKEHYYSIESIFLTKVHSTYNADTYFSLDNISTNFQLVSTHALKDNVPLTFYYYYNNLFLYRRPNRHILNAAWNEFINQNKDCP
jgi:dihydrofolate reductase